MIIRFYLYSILKNLRFADPFLILYLLELQLSYAEIGLLLGGQHLVTVLLEFPSGILADQWGRCRTTALCFVFYCLSFLGFGATDLRGAISLYFWLSGCLILFALGEALRTGSHKAIMLDYLDRRGESQLATSLIGRTRSASKTTSAIAAIAGGIVLGMTGNFAWLFLLSAISAACGVILMLTYPRELEGEHARNRMTGGKWSPLTLRADVWEMWKRKGFIQVFVQSVLFESQLKIALKYFTQPFLKIGLSGLGIPIVSSTAGPLATQGAFWVGVNEFVRDTLGSVGARMSFAFERACQHRSVALNRIYLIAIGSLFALALCALDLRWGLLPGLIVLTGLTILQNLRRPIFVSTLNAEMVKSQRASTLSLESVSRAVTVALLLPGIGWLVDQFGLIAVWVVCLTILLCGLFFKLDQHANASQHT